MGSPLYRKAADVWPNSQIDLRHVGLNAFFIDIGAPKNRLRQLRHRKGDLPKK